MKRYRLAVFDPCEDDEEPEFIGPVYGEGGFDRAVMQAAIRRFNELMEDTPELPYCMAAFPVAARVPRREAA